MSLARHKTSGARLLLLLAVGLLVGVVSAESVAGIGLDCTGCHEHCGCDDDCAAEAPQPEPECPDGCVGCFVSPGIASAVLPGSCDETAPLCQKSALDDMRTTCVPGFPDRILRPPQSIHS